ncbi:hypothetical protein Syun_018675 [Stephania yunnanensis]|uniref:Uncharacterized protein n=1 Tax=Stephania yunnanensis TaxID=152371 RepID=A0AAP0NW19_9MAGN
MFLSTLFCELPRRCCTVVHRRYLVETTRRGLAEDDVATKSASPDVADVCVAAVGCPLRHAPVASPPLLLDVLLPLCLHSVSRRGCSLSGDPFT